MKISSFVKNRCWVSVAVSIAPLFIMPAAHAGCLMKDSPITAQVMGHAFMIAPQRVVPDYTALGFRPVDCPGDLSLVRVYVEHLCNASPDGSAPPLNTEAVLGVPRPKACADARAGLAEVTGKNQ